MIKTYHDTACIDGGLLNDGRDSLHRPFVLVPPLYLDPIQIAKQRSRIKLASARLIVQ